MQRSKLFSKSLDYLRRSTSSLESSSKNNSPILGSLEVLDDCESAAVLEALRKLEDDIRMHRQQISELLQHFNIYSENDCGLSTVHISDELEEYKNHIKALTSVCIKETREYVTLSNMKQEAECKVRPDQNEDLVQFCIDLVRNVTDVCGSIKLNKNKNIFKRVTVSLHEWRKKSRFL